MKFQRDRIDRVAQQLGRDTKNVAQMAVAGAAEDFIAAKRQAMVFFDPYMILDDGFAKAGPAVMAVKLG